MQTGDNDSTRGNRIKELLGGATTRSAAKNGRDDCMDAGGRAASGTAAGAFFITSTAIVALVSLTAISYRPSGVVADARDVTSDVREESIAPAPVSLNMVPLRYAVRVVLESGNVFYFDERTAAMLGAVKLASVK